MSFKIVCSKHPGIILVNKEEPQGTCPICHEASHTKYGCMTIEMTGQHTRDESGAPKKLRLKNLPKHHGTTLEKAKAETHTLGSRTR